MLIGSALFASAVLKELAKRADFSNHVELSGSLKDNAEYVSKIYQLNISEGIYMHLSIKHD